MFGTNPQNILHNPTKGPSVLWAFGARWWHLSFVNQTLNVLSGWRAQDSQGFLQRSGVSWIEGNICVSKEREYIAHVKDMVVRRYQKYDDVVEVSKGKLPLYSWANKIHCATKSARGVRNPNGIWISRYSPWWNLKAVLSQFSSSISICRYPRFASSIENTATLPKKSMHLSIQRLSSFLGPKTIDEVHSVCAVSMMFLLSILSISAFSNLRVSVL